MFWQSILTTVLVVAPIVQAQFITDGDLDDYMKNLKSNYKIDPKRRPFFDEYIVREPPCLSQYAYCTIVEFFYRHYLYGVDSVEIKPQYHIDSYVDNSQQLTETTVSTKTSTAQTVAITKHWSIGGVVAKAGLSISAKYESTYTETRDYTETVNIESTCPAGHKCSISTTTLYAVIRGTCNTRPYYQCGSFPFDVCKPGIPSCQQFQHYRRKNCIPTIENVFSACTVTVPLIQEDNTPVRKVVLKTI